jgi:hypothetical protein
MKSLDSLEQKFKLQYFFKQLAKKSKKLPFTGKSNWSPPTKFIPPGILTIIKELKSEVQNLNTVKNNQNLSPGEISALEVLKNNKKIVIKKADKGSATVIMYRHDYIREADRQLNNSSHYMSIPQPIYPATAIVLSKILTKIAEQKLITPKQKAYLMPPEKPRPRQFYLLPKIHKDPNSWTVPGLIPKGRPIVSDCSSESCKIAEYIDHYLKPLAIKHPSYLKDTWDFLEKLTQHDIPPNSLLITLDVESLYTNIQTPEGLLAVQESFDNNPSLCRPDKELIELLKISLECNDFEFNNNFYLQISGTAMGKRFAPHYADIYMAKFEKEVFRIADKKPLVYYRFLDDIFIIWTYSEEEFFYFLNLMNSHSPSINFTHSIQKESINFLDVTLYKGTQFKNSSKLDTKVYFKPTDTHELLHKSSFHPKHTFAGILKSQINRFHKICTNKQDFESACSILFRVLRKKRNYSKRFLRKIKSAILTKLNYQFGDEHPFGAALKCGKTRCECCLWMKETSDVQGPEFDHAIIGKLTCNSNNIIYIIECTKCKEFYVGETSKTLRQRLNGHLSDIRADTEKPIPEHFNATDHNEVRDMVIYPIEQILDQGSEHKNKILRQKIEYKWMLALDCMQPQGLNIKIDPIETIAFTVPYSARAIKAAHIIKKHYSKLQDLYPKYYKDKLVIGYKRNKNLKDILTSSKLK